MKIKLITSLLFFALGATFSHAATITWDGDAGLASGDYNWTTGANWVGDSVPPPGDYGNFARFTDTFFGNQTANVTGSENDRKIQGVIFDNTSGWEITGSQILMREINSSGTGTNIMNSVKTYQGGNNWTIASGSILELNSLYVDGSYNLPISGGGTVVLNSGAGGWSGGKSITVNDVTLQANSSFVFGGSGTVYFNDVAGIIRMQDSVANVQNRIGSSIIDNTGMGLSVTDAGGGYAQISTIPEPASALLMLGGMAMLYVATRRK
jgi:hypothetical protein